MSRDKMLKVYYNDKVIGTLAETSDKRVAFEYDDSWLDAGFTISPFSLPLKKEVFVPKNSAQDGLFGVFRDSLPDAWGRLLLERVLKKRGIDSSSVSMIDRLAMVGEGGMGALTYLPAWDIKEDNRQGTLDEIAEACKSVLMNEGDESLDMLFNMAGSSGGARPKVLLSDEEGDWMVKFPSSVDTNEIGIQEYEYSLAAGKCGIDMPNTKLFESKKCGGYFGIKRFDRYADSDGKIIRKHMVTAEGLLETDLRLPNLDYADLMKLCKILTASDESSMIQMYRRMCFNVLAHNRDDHSKNFSYIYNDEKGKYELSPAYDLTYSNTFYGEHTTSVAGEAANPDTKDLIKVGTGAGLSKKLCSEIAEEIRSIAQPLAAKWRL